MKIETVLVIDGEITLTYKVAYHINVNTIPLDIAGHMSLLAVEELASILDKPRHDYIVQVFLRGEMCTTYDLPSFLSHKFSGHRVPDSERMCWVEHS